MKRKQILIRNLSLFLLLSLVLSSVMTAVRVSVNGKLEEKKFFQDLDSQFDHLSRHLIHQIEFVLDQDSLPFNASEMADRLKKSTHISSIRIYDESAKLLYSEMESKEIFQSEIRHREQIQTPGTLSFLSTGEQVYRSLGGDFYFVFERTQSPALGLSNPNVQIRFLYWLFDPIKKDILLSNDESLLKGDRSEKDLLEKFTGIENQSISWTLYGKVSYLSLVEWKGYQIYILRPLSWFGKKEISFFLFLFFGIFSSLCFLLGIWLIQNGESIFISRHRLIALLFFLFSVFTYYLVKVVFPEDQFQHKWISSRHEEIEQYLHQLEKNVIYQLSFAKETDSLFVDTFDPSLQELYVVESQTTFLWNRFGQEINIALENTKRAGVSQLYQLKSELLLLVPLDGGNKIALVVIQPTFLNAKKKGYHDEFYLLIPKYRFSDNKSKETFTKHPFAWQEDFLSEDLRTHFFPKKVSVFGQSYLAYEGQNPKAMFTKGLVVFRATDSFPLLLYLSLFTIIPLFGLHFYSKFSIRHRKEDEGNSELSPVESVEALSEQVLPLADEGQSSLSPILGEELRSQEEPILTEQKIAESEANYPMGEVPVKNKKPLYIPPKLWNQTSVTLPLPIQEKRDSIFNSDLKKLVDRVKGSPETAEGRRQTDLRREIPSWPIPEEHKFEYSLLDRVYRGDEISLDGIVEYTRNFIQRLGSPRFSYLFLNDSIGSYHSQISFGLDYNTRSNLIFLYNDPYLEFDESGFCLLQITEKLKQDKFIVKKFSWEILAQVESILAFNLEKNGFPGLFLILLDKLEKEKFLDSHKRMIKEKLKQIIPALHVLMEKENKTPELYEDSLSWMLRSFLQATLGGKRNAYVTHVIWENYHPTDENEEKKADVLREVCKVIDSQDRVIENSPNAFVIISAEDIRVPLEKLLKLYPFPYETKYMRYPDDGENYYLYL
ncbi:hypothetical protein LPTSP4_12890 [Leptospira ryugenii]|uniref:Uncharacterized protein n=1 Tax=Leptospira ryugenii TaxID=1917863 RepID=A0A2P2DYT1_9LEPT|nr:hypothetical protein [Leptospira ryugenii]GBF49770.1 hypothetical protein LPTSP4_12890 [Leptospira ryugenii]